MIAVRDNRWNRIMIVVHKRGNIIRTQNGELLSSAYCTPMAWSTVKCKWIPEV